MFQRRLHLHRYDTYMLALCPGQVGKNRSLELKPCSCKRQGTVMHCWIWWQHFSCLTVAISHQSRLPFVLLLAGHMQLVKKNLTFSKSDIHPQIRLAKECRSYQQTSSEAHRYENLIRVSWLRAIDVNLSHDLSSNTSFQSSV